MSENEQIGRRIKGLREARKMTQSDLAEVMHASRETVNQWERGARDMKTGTIIALAKHFGVSCDYILTGVEAEHIDIYEALGLSEDVIALLRDANRHRKIITQMEDLMQINLVDVVNGLLAPEADLYNALRMAYTFFYADFLAPHINPSKPDAPLESFPKHLAFQIHDDRALFDRWAIMYGSGAVYEQAYLEELKRSLIGCKCVYEEKRRKAHAPQEDHP